MTTDEIDISDILEDEVEESPIQSQIIPAVLDSPDSPTRKEITQLRDRLRISHEHCRDLFVDMRTVDYIATPDDSYIEFLDKNYYDKKLYFKVDPQRPNDPKIIIAQQQFCKLLGIPYKFFAANRPSLKMNIVKTWQAGLTADESKAQSVLKIRESKDCSIIRAFIPVTKCSVPLYELIGIILNSVAIPLTMEFVYGDERDDLILHVRFLFNKEYIVMGSKVCVGFSLLVSELDASPFIIEIFLHDKEFETSYISMYGGDPFFRSKYDGIKADQIKDLIPKMLGRIDSEAPEMIERIEKKISDTMQGGFFCAETECVSLLKAKGISGKVRKAVYHQITECQDKIKTPWDIARHVGLVAKDLDSIKRLAVERAAGQYLRLTFSKD